MVFSAALVLKRVVIMLLGCLVLVNMITCSLETNTHPASTSATSTTSTRSTTSKPKTIEQICAERNETCDVCVGNPKCLWCESGSQNCLPYPVSAVIPGPDTCVLSQARWGVCWMNYEALLISMGVIAGTILLLITACCCYCCCCRGNGRLRRRLAREEERHERQRDERRMKNEERRAERNERLNDIRRKYGLVKEETPYRRFEEEA